MPEIETELKEAFAIHAQKFAEFAAEWGHYCDVRTWAVWDPTNDLREELTTAELYGLFIEQTDS